MADKKRDILEFVEQSNFEQMIPTRSFNVLLIEVAREHKRKIINKYRKLETISNNFFT
jgi:hypothetical protein